MKNILRLLFISALFTVAAQAKTLVNSSWTNLAIQGYDAVAFFTDSKPVKGSSDFTATYEGATYRFVSAAHRDAFIASPAKYAPAFGGYCAYGVAKGAAVSVEIDTWQIIDGRLILNYDADVSKKFNADRAGFLKTADQKWSGLVEQKGK